MRPMLKNPAAFPDIVGIWAVEECARAAPLSNPCDNDNDIDEIDLSGLSDPLIELFARMDIAENRAW